MPYDFGGLIFGGAYTWRGLFSEFYGIFMYLGNKVRKTQPPKIVGKLLHTNGASNDNKRPRYCLVCITKKHPGLTANYNDTKQNNVKNSGSCNVREKNDMKARSS